MITAQQAKEISRPKRKQLIDNQLKWVQDRVEECAKSGEMVLTIMMKLLPETESELILKGNFRVYYNEVEGKTVISWY